MTEVSTPSAVSLSDPQAFRSTTRMEGHVKSPTESQGVLLAATDSDSLRNGNESNDDEDKASRAAVACTGCRARKVKCSGDRPACATCAKSSLECIYTPHAKRKRRSKPKGEDGVTGITIKARRNEPNPKESRDLSHIASMSSASLAQSSYPNQPQSHVQRQQDNHLIPPLGVAGPSTYAQAANGNPYAYRPINPNMTSNQNDTFKTSSPRQYQPHTDDPSQAPNLDIINDILSWEGLAQFQPNNNNNQNSISGSSQFDLGVTSNSNSAHLGDVVAVEAAPIWNWDEFLAWHPTSKSDRVGESATQAGEVALADGKEGGVEYQKTVLKGLGTSNGDIQTCSAASRAGAPSDNPSTSTAHFRVPYFRFFGPTAIAPGYKQVIYDVSAPPSPKGGHHPFNFTSALAADDHLQVLDDDGAYPHAEALSHLLPIFLQHFSYFFPFIRFISTSVDPEHYDHPPYLLNIICALAARYSPLYSKKPSGLDSSLQPLSLSATAASHAWASKAKEQINKNLSFSSAHMVETLMLISWYEFGQDRDGGLWMYSGMGLRMGQDLGLDSLVRNAKIGGESSPGETAAEDDELDAWRLHCSLLMMDAIMTIGTGRSGMYLVRNTVIPTFPPLTSAAGLSLPDPFGYLAQILVLVDRTARILAKEESNDIRTQLEKAQSDLNEFHTSLPSELRFETSTFQNYASLGQGSSFVLLHLWFHTLIILSYRPSLLRFDPPDAEIAEGDLASNEIAASSAKTILDIATFAELIDPKAVSQPWINYPLYTAGRTFLSQSLLAQTPPSGSAVIQDLKSAGRVHLAKIARANFQRVVKILTNLQSYWSGVRYIRSALLQKAEGVHSITLIEGDGEGPMSEDLPSPLAALWAGSSTGQGNRSGVVGLSFTGTMNSPTDNFFSLLYPSSALTPSISSTKGESSTAGGLGDSTTV